jgi:predicted alpha/beta superfamily hydrolase
MTITVTGPAVLGETESVRFSSTSVGADLEIRVARPLVRPGSPPPDRLSVVYVLDGDLFFGTVAETARLQHFLFGELPPLLVVGIGYGTVDPRIQGETRTRDLTPTADPTFEEQGRRFRPDWVPLLPEGQRQGGGDRFLDFVERELQPWIRSRWPVDGAALFGSSFGGLLATHALFARPGLFDRYLIASPGLWWHDEVVLKRALASEPPDARVYLAVGAGEEGALPQLARFRMVTNVRTLAERLREPVVEVIPGESHTSVVPIAISHGLRALFRPGVG